LQEGNTDAQGMFELRGSTHELTNIDPVCKVYHDCDVSFLLDSNNCEFWLYVSKH
jgi:hypothetical protein